MASDIKVGDTVRLSVAPVDRKRNKWQQVKGKVVAITSRLIVLDVGKYRECYNISDIRTGSVRVKAVG